MQSVAYFSILLAFASLASASSQPEQVQPGNSASPVVQVEPVQPQPQQPVVNSAPVAVHPEQGGQVVPVEHQIHHHHHEQHYPGASYYAPAGLIQVVGGEQQGVAQGVNKPGQQQPVRSVEQYGQPESAALPPNYKPFGSWGLYIGGNPADGYYTNYYKQLGSSVEKQQQGGEQSVKPTSALSPLLKQASGVSPFAGGDYYPFAYSVNELSSPAAAAVSRNYVSSGVPSSIVDSGVQHSPVQAGAQVYGSPASFESGHYGVSPYYSGVEHYAATKRLGSQQSYQVQQKEMSKAAELPLVQQPAKGYQQSRVYVYPPQQVGPMSAPIAFSQAQPVASAVQHQQQQHQQVVAYPVPVSSQIVGSQAGVDGAFSPYGVHAFTRYAVKPAVVSSAEQPSYHYGVSSQVPAYKQQQQHSHQHQVHHSYAPHTHYYPSVGYYGYPLNQLHYSQGSIVPAVHGGSEQGIYHSPSSQVAAAAAGSQVEASEKSETSEDKSQVNKQQQKRA